MLLDLEGGDRKTQPTKLNIVSVSTLISSMCNSRCVL